MGRAGCGLSSSAHPQLHTRSECVSAHTMAPWGDSETNPQPLILDLWLLLILT